MTSVVEISYHDIMYGNQNIEWDISLKPSNGGIKLEPTILTKQIEVDSDFSGELTTHEIIDPQIEINGHGQTLNLKELKINFQNKTTIAVFEAL